MLTGRRFRTPIPIRHAGVALYVLALAAALAGCGSTSGSSVASLGGPGSTSHGSRGAALHALGDCFRQHGIPGFADPVLDSHQHVYYDSRSLDDASQATQDAALAACQAQMVAAGVNGQSGEPPAPPQLVAAGVKSAQCLRAHGLPDVHDPTSSSDYTPGHGFGLSAADFGGAAPVGGKSNPAVQAAFQACRSLLDAEIRASTLSSLSHD